MTLCQGITFWVIESDENALLLLIHSEVCDISTSLSGIFKIKPVHFSLTQITASDHNSGRRSGHLNWSDRNFKLAISNFVRSCSHTLSNWKCPDLKEVVSYWILMSGSPQDSQTQLRNPQKCGAILHNHIYIQNHNLCNSNVRWMNNPLVAQCFHITDNAFLSLTFHSSSNTT